MSYELTLFRMVRREIAELRRETSVRSPENPLRTRAVRKNPLTHAHSHRTS